MSCPFHIYSRWNSSCDSVDVADLPHGTCDQRCFCLCTFRRTRSWIIHSGDHIDDTACGEINRNDNSFHAASATLGDQLIAMHSSWFFSMCPVLRSGISLNLNCLRSSVRFGATIDWMMMRVCGGAVSVSYVRVSSDFSSTSK